MTRLPRSVLLLGIAGLIPFAAVGFAAILPSGDPRRVQALIGYGAVILSFLGGVHQGFAMMAPAPLPGAPRPSGDWARAERQRLLGASACALAAWVSLLAAIYLRPWAGLLLLIASYIALTIIEQSAVARGWMPKPYMWLRWALTVVVVVILAAVMVLRLLGSAS